MKAAKTVKQDGNDNNLIEHILNDAAFGLTKKELEDILCVEQFTGLAQEQTEDFLLQVKTIIEANKEFLGAEVNISV